MKMKMRMIKVLIKVQSNKSTLQIGHFLVAERLPELIHFNMQFL